MNNKSKYFNAFDKNQIKERDTIFKNIVFTKDLPDKLDQLKTPFSEYISLKQKAFTIAIIASLFVFMFVQIWDITFLILIAVIMILMSFLAVDLYISDKVRLKDFRVKTEIPIFLDTLTFYFSSLNFETFGKALYSVTNLSDLSISKEINEIVKPYSYLTEDEILDLIVKKVPDKNIKSLCASVRITTKYGGTLKEKVSSIAKDSYKNRLINLKQQSIKLSGILLLPIIVFHMPIILIIIIYPMIKSISF